MTGTVDTQILLQDLRNVTVRILLEDTVLGTGVIVTPSGVVVTCGHVLRAAGLEASRGAGAGRLRVAWARRAGHGAETRSATVLHAFTESDDDLVCLQLDGRLPLPADQVAVIGGAHGSWWHDFQSYGYRRLDRYRSGIARGVILGEVEPPEDTRLLVDPVQLQSNQIDAGMSGSAVLDMERNLVVGIVSEAWFSGMHGKDHDTAWAVNLAALEYTSIDVQLRTESQPLRRADQPVVDPALIEQAVPAPGHRLHHAPASVREWVGRQELIEWLGREWRDGRHLVVGLIGFGGEGKSSLARRWLDVLHSAHPNDRPAGVFWWNFTARPSADEFLNAALEFMSGGRIAVGELPGGGARAAFAAGLLATGRYLFVLDGLEATQHQQDDGYGSITSPDLRDFLGYFATPGHQSLCLITSRSPVVDLMSYITYRHIDVEGLPVDAGRALLSKLGVVGPDASLAQVASDWGGHALTLGLLAGYLVKRFQGDVRRISTIPPPDPSLPRHEMVRRVLDEYDACLSAMERDFLIRFSIFRTPVDDGGLALALATADEPTRTMLQTSGLKHLVAARILRQDAPQLMSMHPLVRDHYAQVGDRDPAVRRTLHATVTDYYLGATAALPDPPRLGDVVPLIEAAHHMCRSEQFEQACDLIYDRLYQGARGLMTLELNAYESVLSVLLEFFPGQRLPHDPTLAAASSRSWVLHETATCLQMLGRLREAASLFRRAMREFIDQRQWHDAAVSCQNLAELWLCLGSLPACGGVVEKAFELAGLAEDKEDELVAETLRGALAHLQGRSDEAGDAFGKALELAARHTPIPALYSSSGVRYAEHLRRAGRRDEAEQVCRTNLRICTTAGWQADAASCHIGIGDLLADAGNPNAALKRYERAIAIARNITRRDVLIQALLARGRAITGHRADAEGDLDRALTMATIGGYRLAEIDCRLALANLHHAGGAVDLAWDEVTHAEQASIECSYHWGEVDAQAAMRRFR